jgi:hypothetical protein
MLKFEDVVNCRTVEEFNSFVGRYLAEKGLESPTEERRKTYWALFYRWKEGFIGAGPGQVENVK